MRARQIPHLVRISDNDCKCRFCCLFNADARLSLSLRCGGGRRLHWRRWSRASRYGLVLFVIVQVHRIHHPRQGRGRRGRRLARISACGLLLRRRGGSFRSRWCCSAQGTERVLNRFEFRSLSAILSSSWASSGGGARCGGDVRNRTRSRFGVILLTFCRWSELQRSILAARSVPDSSSLAICGTDCDGLDREGTSATS
jgi:hypothetical protein